MNKKQRQEVLSKDTWVEEIDNILDRNNKQEIRAFFSFDKETSDDEVLLLFNLWGRKFFIGFYKAEDAPFHEDIDQSLIAVYRGRKKYFVDVAFRGAAKTTRTKLFFAFVIANDLDHYRKSFKVLASDGDNSKQIATDVYNMLIIPKVQHFYPEIFAKSDLKRQETMGTWTTTAGIKMDSGTVGTEQRGDLQGEEESNRPDFIWFDDFETRATLRSAVKTKAIFDNMEEAKDGLAKGGAALYNCNYLSERGNVHRFITTKSDDKIILITPIIKKGKPTWPSAYSLEEIEGIKRNASDFAGEYLCEPSAGFDIFFDRNSLKKQERKEPIRTIGEFKIYHEYDPSHRYGAGHDIGGGVGLDSSTSVFMDFSTRVTKVVGVFKSNIIKPDTFAYEIKNEADRFGAPVVAPENNNMGSATIAILKTIYDNIFFTEEKDEKVGVSSRSKTYGWNTNSDSKPKMLFALKKAVEDGHLELSDEDLINEMNSYTRDDLMDKEEDARLTTRHFDLLIACAIAYQMRNYASPKKEVYSYQQPNYVRPTLDDDE